MFEKCSSCYREYVFFGGVCRNCGAYKPNKKPDWIKSSGSLNTSGDFLSALPFFVGAAAFLYVWSSFDNLLYGAISAAVAWRFAESRLGQILLRFLVFFAGLGIAWFFIELSKTYR